MLINLIIKFSENYTFDSFDESKNFSLYKSFESDFIPRVNDYVYDSGFGKEFLVMKVEWNYENNQCNVYLDRSNIGNFEEVKIQVMDAGWKGKQY
ncbi:hypothetical protein AMS59_04830 [Lysinibacillus sp. FJAT-14745]|uniref:hypothetical protein n=1 Tax=Lysinibacillus sp. FJAT-14745 TaxID=1704289 RepID=UPI0006AB7CE1|nr:hypothetical protein [Lysinibacillus sp. FJAT-14745]KOP80700.1 hypothetical protein AMS59_04830 [Lysinibacillus sp. FJAT-14745]